MTQNTILRKRRRIRKPILSLIMSSFQLIKLRMNASTLLRVWKLLKLITPRVLHLHRKISMLRLLMMCWPSSRQMISLEKERT